LELGQEATPHEYINNMVYVFAEVHRVLRSDGVLFVNIGDSYATAGKDRTESQATAMSTLRGGIGNQINVLKQKSKLVSDLKKKDKVGIPERFALAMQEFGWYWRDTIIWHKPAPMPSSVSGWRWERCRVKVEASAREFKEHDKLQGARAANGKDFASSAGWTDCPGCDKCRSAGGYVLRRGSWRTTTSHEYIFMFTKSDQYFCDAVAVREPAESSTIERNQYSRVIDDPDEQFAVAHDHEFTGATRNPRSVWRIASGGSSLKHYAMFPPELPRRCIEAATPSHGVCVKCGAPWARIIERVDTGMKQKMGDNWDTGPGSHGSFHRNGKEHGQAGVPIMADKTVGWRATCRCGTEERVPATVLDCFGGSGTTAEEAIGMGRRAILCELNPEYVDIIRQRLNSAFPLLVSANIV
jgi:DNA modification methylase